MNCLVLVFWKGVLFCSYMARVLMHDYMTEHLPYPLSPSGSTNLQPSRSGRVSASPQAQLPEVAVQLSWSTGWVYFLQAKIVYFA